MAPASISSKKEELLLKDKKILCDVKHDRHPTTDNREGILLSESLL